MLLIAIVVSHCRVEALVPTGGAGNDIKDCILFSTTMGDVLK